MTSSQRRRSSDEAPPGGKNWELIEGLGVRGVCFSNGSLHLPYVEAHEAGDEAALLQSVGQAHHARKGKLSKHWTTHANRMNS